VGYDRASVSPALTAPFRGITLQQTWRDQEQQKFQEEFEQTVKVLQKFLKASEIHVPFLMRKADRIDEYLQQR
jgi:uncharacterized FlaG/YvyC family protein